MLVKMMIRVMMIIRVMMVKVIIRVMINKWIKIFLPSTSVDMC